MKFLARVAIVPAAVLAVGMGGGIAAAETAGPAVPVLPTPSDLTNDVVLGGLPGQMGSLCEPYRMIPFLGIPLFNICLV